MNRRKFLQMLGVVPAAIALKLKPTPETITVDDLVDGKTSAKWHHVWGADKKDIRREVILHEGGRISQVAVWNMELDNADVLALGMGISPLYIKPDNLIEYCPHHQDWSCGDDDEST